MATWSGIRAKLEKEYLAPSLRGHITYFATSYSRCPDHEGRAAVLYDGKEILKSNYYEHMISQSIQYYKSKDDESGLSSSEKWRKAFDLALNEGTFDQTYFYEAFGKFDNQDIKQSLVSENPIVRLFAILDRRVGKRTLINLMERIENELEWLKPFYFIRLEAENITYN
ncbi:SF0329 family protein [Anaeromicropila populeti]|uniref:Uncharacterized protein n=1 Tax=Anaeromicropila populeti TaxID=37658 RepID=A0A1I6LKK7_9FIRM|nr:hypothetical protein [Anaeromicropila populeti]SFS03923.1 hypothetical protein SAMN05661086_03355 [Anaeromicropila populeti]